MPTDAIPASEMPLAVDAQGLVRGARFLASPNFDERPPDSTIDLLVIHAISLPPGEFGGGGIEALFLDRLDPRAHPYYETIAGLRVSAHFVIHRDGALVQFVSCLKRAWHAGRSAWNSRERCNDFSIGIELEGWDAGPFETEQYVTLAALTRSLRSAYPIDSIAGHSDIAPGRKTDPGPHFDWARYRALLA